MNILKAIGRYAASSVLRGCLLLFPLLLAGFLVFGTAASVKNILRDSGIYDAFVPEVLETSARNSDESGRTLLQNQRVREAALSTFNPTLLQSSLESLVNGSYAWLDGTAQTLTFQIDLTDTRAKLTNLLAVYGEEKARSLPQCTIEQMRAIGSNQNILEVPCLPIGIDPTRAAQQFSADVVNNANFLEEPVITEKDLPKNELGQTVSQQFPDAPQYFQILTWAPWLVLTLIVLSGWVLYMLHDQKRRAQSLMAWALISSGLLLLLGALLYTAFLKGEQITLAGIVTNDFNRAISFIVHEIAGRYVMTMSWTGSAYLGLGVLWLVVLHRMAGNLPTEATSSLDTTKTEDGQLHNERNV